MSRLIILYIARIYLCACMMLVLYFCCRLLKFLLFPFLFAHLVKYLFTTLWAYISGIEEFELYKHMQQLYISEICSFFFFFIIVNKKFCFFSFRLILLYKWNTVFRKKNKDVVVIVLFCFARVIWIKRILIYV
jgi:hypothetical protein